MAHNNIISPVTPISTLSKAVKGHPIKCHLGVWPPPGNAKVYINQVAKSLRNNYFAADWLNTTAISDPITSVGIVATFRVPVAVSGYGNVYGFIIDTGGSLWAAKKHLSTTAIARRVSSINTHRPITSTQLKQLMKFDGSWLIGLALILCNTYSKGRKINDERLRRRILRAAKPILISNKLNLL